jgi:uncharacterized protein YfdQ (DUF2303 family)
MIRTKWNSKTKDLEMTEEQKTVNDIEAAARLADLTREVPGADRPLVILRDHERIEDIEKLLDSPRRIRRVVEHSDWDSFLLYAESWKNNTSTVYISESSITLVVDGPTEETPSWETHKAVFPLVASPAYKAWCNHVSAQGTSVSQTAFALLIERRAKDLVSPTAAHMLEIANTLELKKNVDWKSAQRLRDGTVQFMFEETVSAKAGQKGQLEIPETFQISVALYEGAEPVTMDVKLRYRFDQGKITFLLEWEDQEEAERQTRAKLKADVEAAGVVTYLANRSL